MDLTVDFLKDYHNIHFVGIGGISMSGLAEILVGRGYNISGSDITLTPITERLQDLGVKVYQGHSADYAQGADLIVYTAAVKQSNPELVYAQQYSIPTMERCVLLGLIMQMYKYPVAVAGTHGKTTTTSMISVIFLEAGLDPTILVGGELKDIGGNVRVGQGNYLVTEACEYVDSFLQFYPYTALVLNVEEDHLDYFNNLQRIVESFKEFVGRVPDDGCVIVCGDDKNALTAVETATCKVLTYGIDNQQCDFIAGNIVFDAQDGFPQFDIVLNDKAALGQKKLARVKLSVPGRCNIYNGLGAFICGHVLGVDCKSIEAGLNKFTGAKRRFDVKGKKLDMTIIDDYAHHPTEIKSTVSSALKMSHNNLWCIFQPHTYTRTSYLLNDFAKSFIGADRVIVTDIYAAREPDDGKIHSRDLADSIARNQDNVRYVKKFEDIAQIVLDEGQPGDIVITIGAGDVFKVADIILSA